MSRSIRPHFVSPQSIYFRDTAGNGILAFGTTVPSDGAAGYASGCLFMDTDASAGAQLFVNEGSATSADFNAIPTASSTGAADIGIADAGSFTAQTTVEAAIQEIYQSIISTQVVVPMRLDSFREVDGNKDVGNSSAPGILASNTTPTLEATTTTEHMTSRWVTGNVDQIAIGITLPEDIDDTADAYVDLYVQANTTDQAPTFTVETSWLSAAANGVGTAGSLVTDTATAVTSTGIQEITATIGSGDVPAGAVGLTLGLTPATHGTSEFTLYGARFRYKRKLLTS